jgi:hypothetical protein
MKSTFRQAGLPGFRAKYGKTNMITAVHFRTALLAVGGVLSVAVAYAQTTAEPSVDTKSDEYLLLGSPNRGAGEPWVYVNPKDPNNIIVVAMATLNRLPTGEPPIVPRTTPEGVALRIRELSVPDGSRTDVAVTWDGGKTWTYSEDHFRKILAKNRCSDSFAGAGPNGFLYLGCLAYLNPGSADYDEYGASPNGEAKIYRGGTAIARSEDKGKKWSDPVWVQPLEMKSPSLYPPSVHPIFGGAGPVDRPNFDTDASTGTIYLTGSGAAEIDPPGGGAPVRGGHVFLRASHDGGKTWGLIYPTDTPDYPGRGGSYSAAFGHLVVAYTATAAANEKCPCNVLGISQDDGRTFTHKIIPAIPPADSAAPAPGGRGGGGARGGMIAADPTKEGRYAVATTAGQKVVVQITEDGGNSWLPPVAAVDLPANASFGQHAIKYGPRGDLGLIWKQMYRDRSYDMWSSVSRDGGRSFKTVRVSHAVSPTYNPERGNFMLGDDLSSMDIDSQYLHVVWGDNRSGFEGTWYGRVPLSAY